MGVRCVGVRYVGVRCVGVRCVALVLEQSLGVYTFNCLSNALFVGL